MVESYASLARSRQRRWKNTQLGNLFLIDQLKKTIRLTDALNHFNPIFKLDFSLSIALTTPLLVKIRHCMAWNDCESQTFCVGIRPSSMLTTTISFVAQWWPKRADQGGRCWYQQRLEEERIQVECGQRLPSLNRSLQLDKRSVLKFTNVQYFCLTSAKRAILYTIQLSACQFLKGSSKAVLCVSFILQNLLSPWLSARSQHFILLCFLTNCPLRWLHSFADSFFCHQVRHLPFDAPFHCENFFCGAYLISIDVC